MQQCHMASLPVGVLSLFVKERGKYDFNVPKMPFFFFFSTLSAPILSLYGKAPDDGVKLASNKYWIWRTYYSTHGL